MSVFDSDPRLVPAPLRVAAPLFERFGRSSHAVEAHPWHAQTTLPVLALFVAMQDGFVDGWMDWGSLDPDALLAASREVDPEDVGFLLELLEISSAFYAFLGDVGEVPLATADRIHARLAELAAGLGPRYAEAA
ncbi:MAG: hypothetical protein AB8I08_25365 [Sandaracinaceae bacterium]